MNYLNMIGTLLIALEDWRQQLSLSSLVCLGGFQYEAGHCGVASPMIPPAGIPANNQVATLVDVISWRLSRSSTPK